MPRDRRKISILLRIKTGFDINLTSYRGWTVLMIACANGHVDIADKHITVDAEVNLKNDLGWTAAMRTSWLISGERRLFRHMNYTETDGYG